MKEFWIAFLMNLILEFQADNFVTKNETVCSGGLHIMQFPGNLDENYGYIQWKFRQKKNNKLIATLYSDRNYNISEKLSYELGHNWNLHLIYTSVNDTGLYTREVYSSRKTYISRIFLTVLEPPKGPPELVCTRRTDNSKECYCSKPKQFGSHPVSSLTKVIKSDSGGYKYECCFEKGEALRCIADTNKTCKTYPLELRTSLTCLGDCRLLAGIFVSVEALVLASFYATFFRFDKEAFKKIRRIKWYTSHRIAIASTIFAIILLILTPFLVCNGTDECSIVLYRVIYGCGASLFPTVMTAVALANVVSPDFLKQNRQNVANEMHDNSSVQDRLNQSIEEEEQGV